MEKVYHNFAYKSTLLPLSSINGAPEPLEAFLRQFPLVRNSGKTGASDDTSVRYNDNDDWPIHPSVGIYFQYGLVDEFMHEWLLRQQELHAGEITRDEYFEWK